MFSNRFLALFFASSLAACKVTTLPMHEPVYPASGESVTFTLDAHAQSGISRISLFEEVSTIDAAGTVTAGPTTLLGEWEFSFLEHFSTTVSYTKGDGYSANQVVRYRFCVEPTWGQARWHEVLFAIRPYPVPNQPAPVYAQGDPSAELDIVFIPDTDITDLAAFRDHCRRMITEAMWHDPTLREFTKSFNYYINPVPGTAGGIPVPPANWKIIKAFAEAMVLMHETDLDDFAYGPLISTEVQNRGTFLHELAHVLFLCMDEYKCGEHDQYEHLPNNWVLLDDARAAAPSRHKTASDAAEIGDGWSKLCAATCVLNDEDPQNPGTFDAPCVDRLLERFLLLRRFPRIDLQP